jgi:hypothetical protein
MKQILILTLIAASFAACKKGKSREYFNEKGLIFVAYDKGEKVKFIDTGNYVNTLTQFSYKRDFRFREGIALWGGVGPRYEEYLADYGDYSYGGLRVSVSAPDKYSIKIDGYWAEGYGNLPSPIGSLTVNGKTYSNVYPLVVLKAGTVTGSPVQQAILYWNKEHGAIQLLYPSGKAMVRVD